MDLIALDDRLLETAAILDPQILRSLDAIQLAAAQSLGADLDAIVTYDDRMLDGARVLGLPTSRPGLRTPREAGASARRMTRLCQATGPVGLAPSDSADPSLAAHLRRCTTVAR